MAWAVLKLAILLALLLRLQSIDLSLFLCRKQPARQKAAGLFWNDVAEPQKTAMRISITSRW